MSSLPPSYNSPDVTTQTPQLHRLTTKCELLLPTIDKTLKHIIKTQPLSSAKMFITSNEKYFYNSVSCCKNLWCCVNYRADDCFCCYCNNCCGKRKNDGFCLNDGFCWLSYFLCCVPVIFECYYCCYDMKSDEPGFQNCSSNYISNMMIESCQHEYCCSCCYWKVDNNDMNELKEILEQTYVDVFDIKYNITFEYIRITPKKISKDPTILCIREKCDLI